MKKLLSIGLFIIFISTLTGCQYLDRAIKGDKYVDDKIAQKSRESAEKVYQKKFKEALKASPDKFPQLSEKVDKNQAEVILITSQGDITIKLFPKLAPLAVENFLTHAKEGYYNGLSFHRVISDFMIQTGDPKGDGSGGQSIWYDKDPDKDNGQGFPNEISPYLYNIRGALAMANAGPDTNGSQFFINQNTANQGKSLSSDNYPQPIIDAYNKGGNPSLDGGYTVFGQVITGMDVVDKIAKTEVDEKDKPKEKILIKEIKINKDYTFKY
ncbi:peptidylprolyl isomerase [Streptococcus parauberis]|uniref:Peptidyl-prolyl cis-trans isomerase n=1 Tax=Streptococcus parauberis TaxID=1348 RepID=A0AAE4KY11_9STRE|nr:peptidylprolyl isomerase [Streptococcus parauberis]EMF49299.1 Peptidyl-prolyl cis-trans isomerase [Streptococcus parauberis KRS-02109]KYP17531.1 putative peptidyl-prolyl cis-trans isomerase [Streptococcus parauberis]KYP18813.1 putative peptidyl-prolyl cis-trans isomerase [Streptococcus parauberis]KYP20214.1 putative peptidyl-prolyl cis-trans isomerase [Streptococcus parauberis]KYP24259.1 putative peptidyl-prolyl cis-trans isomerase [Streptococcus parauberis]